MFTKIYCTQDVLAKLLSGPLSSQNSFGLYISSWPGVQGVLATGYGDEYLPSPTYEGSLQKRVELFSPDSMRLLGLVFRQRNDLLLEYFKEPHRRSPELTEGNNEKSKSRMTGSCCQGWRIFDSDSKCVWCWLKIGIASVTRDYMNTPRTVSMRWICSRQSNTDVYFFFFI
jgi:hypothetical protein